MVASEVSKLADRSSTSTKEIESLIRESVKSVARGVEAATGSQAAMEQIRNASQKVKDTVAELTQAAAASVEQMSSSTLKLSEMAQELQKLTAQSKIVGDGQSRDGQGPPAPSPAQAIRA